MPVQVPLWAAAVNGDQDWEAIYKGYESAVDWLTAGFSGNSVRPTSRPSSYSPFAARKVGREVFL